MADLLPPLASARELAAITGRSAADQNLVAALRAASSRFRGKVGHSVSLATETLREFDGDGTSSLYLEAIPIVSVDALLVDDVALAAGTDYRVSKRAGLVKLTHGRFPRLLGCIQATYTHGYDATPDTDEDVLPLPNMPGDIQTAVLELAQTILTVTPGVQAQTVLGDSITFGAAATIGATQQWSDTVAAYTVGRGDRA